MHKNSLTVNILGTTFTIKSENNTEYLERVVAYFNDKIEEARRGPASLNDTLKIALLAGLNLVDELFKTKQAAAHPLDGPHPLDAAHPPDAPHPRDASHPSDGTYSLDSIDPSFSSDEKEIEQLTEKLIDMIDESLMER